MVFRCYRTGTWYEVSKPVDGKMTARFEVYYLGDSSLIQSDTVDDIYSMDFEDANFDGILDLKIVTNEGASGIQSCSYYIYSIQTHRFEFALGDLPDPVIHTKDSTITSSASCCQGRMGSGQVYKLINHSYKKVGESQYSDSGSFTKRLIGDSLVVTSRQSINNIGENILADSSWEYLFGKLRIVQVDLKSPLQVPVTPEQWHSATAYEDVMGRFLFVSSESFRYTKVNDSTLQCSRTYKVVNNSRWVPVKDTTWLIRD